MTEHRVWATIARVFLFWIATVVVLATTSRYLGQDNSTNSAILSVLSAAVLTILLTIFFARWQKIALADTGIVPGKKTLPNFSMGFLLGCFIGALQTSPVLFSAHVKMQVNQNVDSTQVALACFLFFLLAYREELAFRGFALQSLNKVSGPILALVITTLFFIAEHIIGGMSWEMAAWGTGLGSILFGLAALQSKGIALPIGLHAAWNIMQWGLGFKNNTGVFHIAVDPGFEKSIDIIGSASYIICMCSAIILFCYNLKKKGIKERNANPR